MKRLTDTYTLHNGVEIPCVGFGTWQIPQGDAAKHAVEAALDVGYRHIDTAAAYGNEESVGRAVKESGIDREDLFITSKLQNAAHGYQETLAAFGQTMAHLGLEYLDLYLIHWPNPIHYRDRWQEANAGTWKAFEELHNEGRIRAIGVSNFHPHHLEALAATAAITPHVNQIRLCPGDTQDEVTSYCRQHDILLEAYSPLGTGAVFAVDAITALAAEYGKTPAQIALRWSLQKNFLPLPKSTSRARIEENAQIFDFTLSAADLKLLDSLEGACGTAQDPDKTTF